MYSTGDSLTARALRSALVWPLVTKHGSPEDIKDQVRFVRRFDSRIVVAGEREEAFRTLGKQIDGKRKS
jgi:hypothetical protein